jgi:[protein-PII] uridylyltransferase
MDSAKLNSDQDFVNFKPSAQNSNAAVNRLSRIKAMLKTETQSLDSRFLSGEPIESIVYDRAKWIDQLLGFLWTEQKWPNQNIALLAVGGFGRGELFPYSDIDLLILTETDDNEHLKQGISNFITALWDVGLEARQSVRSLSQCSDESRNDITVATSLMESRTLAGSKSLQYKLNDLIAAEKIWPVKEFFHAKVQEQEARHQKYDDTDYALQPNVKTSPGGLRDIQTISWIAMRQFKASTFDDFVRLGLLNDAEETMIKKGRSFLWRIRYGLHFIEGRGDDRLTFDKQRELAKIFGYEDDPLALGVEKLMKEYYLSVSKLRELNDLVLQHFEEAILRADTPDKVRKVNNRLNVRNNYIEVVHGEIFQRYPFTLIEIFLSMAQNPSIMGITAPTIRLIRENLSLVDEKFRKDIRCTSLFTELLRSPHKLTLQLRRMARYGILGRYLPEFGKIMGQMQHDMFHIYTVDAHTFQVIENMRRFSYDSALDDFPIASGIVKKLPKIELLYIAGLYHDIAKGRGGNHSELGQQDAIDFCLRHHLSQWDAKLVAWLVKHHLLMSMTAQRKDISDPDVIKEFAENIGDKLHLDYLYALTVADIRATNPELWNSWRASLTAQLYNNTKKALRRGLENPIDRKDLIEDKKNSAHKILIQNKIEDNAIASVWEDADDEYFIRESSNNIAWHTEEIINFSGLIPLVSIRELNLNEQEVVTQIFIYTQNSDFLFANMTVAIERLGLNIQSARIFTSPNDNCMNTFIVLEKDGNSIGENSSRIHEVRNIIRTTISNKRPMNLKSRFRDYSDARLFSKEIYVRIINFRNKAFSTLEINCPDYPGILAFIGSLLAEEDLRIRDARITTLGERVEDLFYVTDSHNNALRGTKNLRIIEEKIKEKLKERIA